MADNMKEKYESLSLAVLRDVAKSRGIKGTSTMRKEAVIQVMLAEDEISQGDYSDYDSFATAMRDKYDL